jgi:glycosyltransferase involved in cell wall biosynthesis
MKKPKNVKICLNAMVGNEEATITRMLKSVVGYVDYYVIQCNGKIDNTKQIIDDFFAQNGVPGFTYEIDWDYPGWNRDHTLQTALKADHGCDWILRMDADEQLSVDENFDWSPFNDTMIDSFNIVADPGDAMYYRTWMWNAHRPWFFAHDKRHETIHLPVIGEGFNRVNLETGFRQVITNDGETWFAPMKFLKDALELESDKVPSNKVIIDGTLVNLIVILMVILMNFHLA